MRNAIFATFGASFASVSTDIFLFFIQLFLDDFCLCFDQYKYAHSHVGEPSNKMRSIAHKKPVRNNTGVRQKNQETPRTKVAIDEEILVANISRACSHTNGFTSTKQE